MATPVPRLRDFSVGDTVKLKGAMTDPATPLYIGNITDNGYYQLWKSKKAFDQGKPWDHAAAGSHGAQ